MGQAYSIDDSRETQPRPTKETIEITENDLRLKQGDSYTHHLYGNQSSTTWRFEVKDGNPDTVQVISNFTPNPDMAQIGYEGIHTYIIRAMQPGRVTLMFTFGRPEDSLYKTIEKTYIVENQTSKPQEAFLKFSRKGGIAGISISYALVEGGDSIIHQDQRVLVGNHFVAAIFKEFKKLHVRGIDFSGPRKGFDMFRDSIEYRREMDNKVYRVSWESTNASKDADIVKLIHFHNRIWHRLTEATSSK